MDLERTDKTSRRVKTFEGDDVAHEAGGAMSRSVGAIFVTRHVKTKVRHVLLRH